MYVSFDVTLFKGSFNFSSFMLLSCFGEVDISNLTLLSCLLFSCSVPFSSVILLRLGEFPSLPSPSFLSDFLILDRFGVESSCTSSECLGINGRLSSDFSSFDNFVPEAARSGPESIKFVFFARTMTQSHILPIICAAFSVVEINMNKLSVGNIYHYFRHPRTSITILPREVSGILNFLTHVNLHSSTYCTAD